jgi:hypothetical protein
MRRNHFQIEFNISCYCTTILHSLIIKSYKILLYLMNLILQYIYYYIMNNNLPGLYTLLWNIFQFFYLLHVFHANGDTFIFNHILSLHRCSRHRL